MSDTFLVAAIAILIGVQTLTCGLIAQRFEVKYGSSESNA